MRPPRRALPGHRAERAGTRALALGLLAATLSVLSALIAPKAEQAASAWRGYRSLLVEAAVPEKDLLAALTAGGFRNVISESTEPVLVSDWAELESTTLGSARHRLVGADPRRDAYLRALPGWFEAFAGGKPYRVCYIPAPGPFFPDAALRSALEPFEGRYLLPDESEGAKPSSTSRLVDFELAAAILLAAACLGAFLRPRLPALAAVGAPTVAPLSVALPRLALRLALLAPWLCLAAAARPSSAVAALFGLALVDLARRLDLPVEEFRRTLSLRSALDSLARQAPPPLFLATGALTSLVLAPSAAPAAGLALLGSLAAAAALSLAPHGRRGEAARPRFIHKPIAAPRRGRPRLLEPSPAWLAGLSCAVALLWAAGALVQVPGAESEAPGGAVFPRPVPIGGNPRPGPEEARARIKELGEGRLPDLADWLAHVASQEALPLERVDSKRADPFEPVSISRPEGDEAMLRFDEAWARAAYRRISPASVEGMLLAQGGPVAARPGPGDGKGRPLAPIEALRYIVLLVPSLGGIAAGLSASRGSSGSGTRQEP